MLNCFYKFLFGEETLKFVDTKEHTVVVLVLITATVTYLKPRPSSSDEVAIFKAFNRIFKNASVPEFRYSFVSAMQIGEDDTYGLLNPWVYQERLEYIKLECNTLSKEVYLSLLEELDFIISKKENRNKVYESKLFDALSFVKY